MRIGVLGRAGGRHLPVRLCEHSRRRDMRYRGAELIAPRHRRDRQKLAERCERHVQRRAGRENVGGHPATRLVPTEVKPGQ
jgi:hypothetical protein